MAQPNEKYLMLYSTTDGHTKTIMDTMAQQIKEESSVQCDVDDVTNGGTYTLSDYSKVMIGASIRYGYFSSTLTSYIEQHYQELNAMPTAFFGVNLTARKMDKNTTLTNAYTRKFLEQSPMVPLLAGVFAGALWYPRYTTFDRVMIQFIMKVTGGETDATKEVVYTDWSAVRTFAKDFMELPRTVLPRMKPARANESASMLSLQNGTRVALAIAGASSAVIFYRRFLKTRAL